MKLTEKELNEFPIGTKIYCAETNECCEQLLIKQENDVWKCRSGGIDLIYCNGDITEDFENIEKIEIPTYTEYIPPKSILDEKEKEYLSFVIKPWKNKIGYIEKRYGADKEWIEIYLKKGNSYTNLPRFKKGTMYKGMELDREYSLEDLGI